MDTFTYIIMYVGFALWYYAGYKCGMSFERRKNLNKKIKENNLR